MYRHGVSVQGTGEEDRYFLRNTDVLKSGEKRFMIMCVFAVPYRPSKK